MKKPYAVEYVDSRVGAIRRECDSLDEARNEARRVTLCEYAYSVVVTHNGVVVETF